jgi:hypothetical protein
MTTSPLKKGLQVMNELMNYLLKADCFMERCLEFKQEMEAAIAPYRVYKDMHEKKKKHLKNTFLFTVSSCLPFCNALYNVHLP